MMVLVAQSASAYVLGSPYTWTGTPNYNAAATLHTGTIDLTRVVIGDFLGRNAGDPNAGFFGSSGAFCNAIWISPSRLMGRIN